MSKVKAEYIWLDGHKPTSKLRSKTKIIDGPVKTVAGIPQWGLMDPVQNKRLVMIVIAR